MTTNGAQWQSTQQPAETIDLTRDDFDEDDEDEEGSDGSIASDSERNAKRQKTETQASSAAASYGGYNTNGGAVNHFAGMINGGAGGAYRSPQVLNTPPINANFTPSLGAPLMQPSSQWMSQTVPTGYLAPSGGSRFPYDTLNGSAPQTPSLTNGQNGGDYYPNAGPAPSGFTSQQLPPSYTAAETARAPSTSVIDLTASNTPSPGSNAAAAGFAQQGADPTKQRKDTRKDVICIGELQVTALVLYPIPYLVSAPTPVPREEYVSVRLIYDAAVKKRSRVNEETIRITAPTFKGPTGEHVGGEDFGVVEQRVANVLGPLMSKVLIRVSATIRRAAPNVSVPVHCVAYFDQL